MIIIPFFGDQYDNAKHLEKNGIAIRMLLNTITTTKLKNAIEEIIGNSE